MDVFTPAELSYLREGSRLARVATVGVDGTPHVTPIGMWSVTDEYLIEATGHSFARTKKFRDVARTGRAAIVVDDVLPPWQPRGVEIRGRAEAVDGSQPLIRIFPERVVSWGLDDPKDGRQASAA